MWQSPSVTAFQSVYMCPIAFLKLEAYRKSMSNLSGINNDHTWVGYCRIYQGKYNCASMISMYTNDYWYLDSICPFKKVLEDHRIQCQKEGKYDEARIALQRLEDLKLHDEQRQKEALQKRQLEERLGAEEAHMLELQQLNLKWDKKMADYADHAHK